MPSRFPDHDDRGRYGIKDPMMGRDPDNADTNNWYLGTNDQGGGRYNNEEVWNSRPQEEEDLTPLWVALTIAIGILMVGMLIGMVHYRINKKREMRRRIGTLDVIGGEHVCLYVQPQT